MGINNFCKLIRQIREPTDYSEESFDSILFDAQSFLYIAIETSLETNEESFFREVCQSVWAQFYKQLVQLLYFVNDSELLTVVISFDGEGVPMKWPTQRKRRDNRQLLNRRKTLYSCSLFGRNRLAMLVEDYIVQRLKQLKHFEPLKQLNVIISGCGVPGEGEHKTFQIAQQCGLKRPVIWSVDQDVFVIALARIADFERIQIFRYNQFYDVSKTFTSSASVSEDLFETISFLFGNDFVPPVVGITDSFLYDILEATSFVYEHAFDWNESLDVTYGNMDNEEKAAYYISKFVERMKDRLRYTEVAHVDENLIISFWTTHLWVKDYYALRHFPQKYLVNTLFDAFDRNQILTALLNTQFSIDTMREARQRYKACQETRPYTREEVIRAVFADEEAVKRLKPYWMLEQEEQAEEKASCKLLRLTKR